MKKITKKIIEKANRDLLVINFQTYDKASIIGWHKGTGLKVEEWMKLLNSYAKERGRKHFFALTEYGNPAVYFDANNGEEWTKMIGLKSNEKIRFLEEEGWVHISKRKDDDDRNRKFKEPKRH